LFQTVHDFVYFALSDGSRLVGATTDEAHDTWGFFNEVPGIVVEHHLDQHVAGEEFAFAAALLAGAHFDNLFSRHQYLTEKISQGRQRNTLFERLLNLALKSGISVHYVPALIVCSCRHIQPLRLWSEAMWVLRPSCSSQLPISSEITQLTAESSAHSRMATRITTATTINVVCMVSWRVGQTTLRISVRASRPNSMKALPLAVCAAITQASTANTKRPTTR